MEPGVKKRKPLAEETSVLRWRRAQFLALGFTQRDAEVLTKAPVDLGRRHPGGTADVQRVTGLPVFDIVSLVTMAHGALRAGPAYRGPRWSTPARAPGVPVS